MPFVILDRDVVINHDSSDYIKSPDEWRPIPGALEAVAKLNHAGFRVLIATNQSGLSRKLFDIETLNRIHQKMQRSLHDVGGNIEAIFLCPHAERDGCDCRKPKPGLLHQIIYRLQIQIDALPFVWDTLKDIKAAKVAGARPILVRTGLKPPLPPPGVEAYDNLACAADALIKEKVTN